MKLNKKGLKKIKGDASFRVFYRKKKNRKNSIIVYAHKEKEKNLLIYDAVNKLLIKNNIFAPKLYSENYKENFIEIEDFGNNTVFKLLKKNSANKINLYKDSIDLLNNIQKIKQNKIKNFRNKIYRLPKYDKKELLAEAKLFSLWYAKKFIPKKKLVKFNISINKQIKILLANIKIKTNVFVHRDFHVSNLMVHKKKQGIIDTQDALLGNKAYDLASLIDDVRFKTKNKFKDQIYNYFIKSNKNINDKKNFLNDFEILSVLRNMKIIGIFTRLAKRDNKKKYLKLIPYAWELIELRMKKNKRFKPLKDILDMNFPKEIRRLK